MNLLETLKAIHARINHPDKWTIASDFANTDDSRCLAMNAERYSLSGAIRIQEAVGTLSFLDRDTIDAAIHKAAQDLGAAEDCPLMTVMSYSYSTRTTHSDVMQLLEKAIENAAPKPKRFNLQFHCPSLIEAASEAEAVEKFKAAARFSAVPA